MKEISDCPSSFCASDPTTHWFNFCHLSCMAYGSLALPDLTLLTLILPLIWLWATATKHFPLRHRRSLQGGGEGGAWCKLAYYNFLYINTYIRSIRWCRKGTNCNWKFTRRQEIKCLKCSKLDFCSKVEITTPFPILILILMEHRSHIYDVWDSLFA